jgi:hypothetical protein
MLNLYIAICDYLGAIIAAVFMFGLLAQICVFAYENWNPLEWCWKELWILFLAVMLAFPIYSGALAVFGMYLGALVGTGMWTAALMTITKLEG